MKREKIIIVPKMSKFEWDMLRLKKNEEEIIQFYKSGNLNVKKIIESHKRQKQSLKRLEKLFDKAQFVSRNELNRTIAKKAGLVIAFGGDNHFQYVAHFLEDTPLLGINSDPKSSDGALTNFTISEFEDILPFLLDDKFKLVEWQRLEIEIDGKKIDSLSVSEVFLGETKRFNMSRHILKVHGTEEEQKGSGILIVTGVGSTGWYNSACRYLFPRGKPFPKSEGEARFLLTEPHNGKFSKNELIHGSIKGDEVLEFISLNDSQGVLSIDSLKKIKTKEGACVKIKLGKELRVIRK